MHSIDLFSILSYQPRVTLEISRIQLITTDSLLINAGAMDTILDCITTTVNSLSPRFGFNKFSGNKM